MRHKYLVGVCLLYCFLLSSTAFISSVQANEVKEEVEEKQESVLNSIYSKISGLNTMNYSNILTIMIKILKIAWVICYIYICDIIWGHLSWIPHIKFIEQIPTILLYAFLLSIQVLIRISKL